MTNEVRIKTEVKNIQLLNQGTSISNEIPNSLLLQIPC
jgi:hypothetical protein